MSLVDLHGRDDDEPVADAPVIKSRRKADDRALFFAADSAIAFRRAHDVARIPMVRSAEYVGVSQPLACFWSTDPAVHPLPHYGIKLPPIRLLVGAEDARDAAKEIASRGLLGADRAAVVHALALLNEATDSLHRWLRCAG